MTSTHKLAAVALLLLSAAFSETSNADSKRGFRQLTSTHPIAVQRGTKTQVKVRCNFTLDGAYQTFFDRPGISMTYAETAPIDAYTKSRGAPGVPFRFDVTVPETQEPGIYEYRVATKIAVSSAASMMVTDFPVVIEEERENGTAATAQTVAVPSAVCGVVEKFEDVDCYRFSAKAGQELTFNLFAQRVTDNIHSMVVKGPRIYLMDGILTLSGPNGQVIAQNDNFIGGDSFIGLKLPTDGEYTLEVRDSRYAGDPRYSYCVEISDRPFVHDVFPFVVQRGTSTPVAPVGLNLGETKPFDVTVAGEEPAGWQRRRLSTTRGETNPVALKVSEHPQVVVGPQHGSRETAFALTLPVGVNGRFQRPEETHYVSFTATKGKIYRLEVEAGRVGLPTDTVLEIIDATGKMLSEQDDAPQTKDSRTFFTAPADGTYFVAVHDLHARFGDRFLYHLRVEEAEPDFELGGEYYYAMPGPGTHMIWFVKVDRIAGFDGPVEIQVDGLPQGVTYTPVTVPKNMQQTAVILSAAPDAKVNASLVKVFGKARIKGSDGQERDVVQQGRITCEQQAGGGGQARWPIRTQLVGVTEPGDLLKVTAEPAEINLKPGEKAEIKVRIERNADFDDPVTLSLAFDYFATIFGTQLPPGVGMGKGAEARFAGKTLECKFILDATDKAQPVEKLPIGIVARVPVSFSINTNYSTNPIFLTIAPPAK